MLELPLKRRLCTNMKWKCSSHPLLDLLPENPPRGASCEIRLYHCDPDQAADKAEHAGGMVLQPPTDKPHGLRECYILCPDGYAWVPSLAIKS